MQLFKLLALAPLGASLVSAATIRPAYASYAELVARNNDPNNHVVDDKVVDPINHVRKQIPAAQATLDAQASVQVYSNLLDGTLNAIAGVTVDLSLKVKQADGSFAKVLIDLTDIFNLTTDAHQAILAATVDHASSITVQSLDTGVVKKFTDVFGSLAEVFDVWVQDGQFVADFHIHIDALVQVLQKYLNVNEQYVTGLKAEIEGQLGEFAEVVDKAKIKDREAKGDKTPVTSTKSMLLS